eukprot:CAMPEP_0177249810 /NCGR_PEP_ID=MMETSP0367-20130122/52978_1 /TAXON_ID=447022 ORGANISM="Scrippsiella hangoei-like, Strain SHHI-4" /NCGR_SAMPLE_ID=MMETSP0367 /ASSEMBLY_ACC=CAM_ASM_000362 /LENGTH=107 /DNA_ID=CAMNT_0018702395 /DNA_START=50 /DNA_END=370 /DNA_ORIENTATION=+
MASKDARTSCIQAAPPKPMTTALTMNISSYVVGTVVLLKARASSLPLPDKLPLPPDPETDFLPNPTSSPQLEFVVLLPLLASATNWAPGLTKELVPSSPVLATSASS